MLILIISLLICSMAVNTRQDKPIIFARWSISSLITSLVICFNCFHYKFLDKGIGLYHGLFNDTAITHAFHIFLFIITILILQLNSFYSRKVWSENFSSLYKLLTCKIIYNNDYILNKSNVQYIVEQHSAIIIFVLIGGLFLTSSSDLMSIFLSIELQSYGLYILCALYKDSEKSVSASLTYFLLGGLSSCLILLGSALIYSNSGNTSFDGLYIVNNISAIAENSETNDLVSFFLSKSINFCLIIMSIGFLFKISAAPFHFWSPDVYDAIPTVITTFVAIFAKISILVLLLELVHYTSNINVTNTEYSLYNTSWNYILIISSLLSLIIGSVLGLTQYRVKRLYAYSTISHLGFMLLVLSINSIESIQSFIFYLIQYSISNLNAFILLLSMGFSLYLYIEKHEIIKFVKKRHISQGNSNKLPVNITESVSQDINDSSLYDNNKYNDSEASEYDNFLNTDNNEKLNTASISDRNNSPLQLTSQMKGYFYINPIMSLSLALTLFSFVGIPPLIGFFAKQMVLSSALDNGYVFMSLVAIVTSVISAYYYLTLVKQIFFEKSGYSLNPQIKNMILKSDVINVISNRTIENVVIRNYNIKLSSYYSVTISILTIVMLFFILNSQEWLSVANILSLILFNC